MGQPVQDWLARPTAPASKSWANCALDKQGTVHAAALSTRRPGAIARQVHVECGSRRGAQCRAKRSLMVATTRPTGGEDFLYSVRARAAPAREGPAWSGSVVTRS
jgi:hypothetical protein